MLTDAWHFMRHGVFENGGRWLRLILAFILLAIPMNGYVMRIYRGTESAPEVDQWGRLFIDGLKLIVISMIYMIPFWLLWFASYWQLFAGAFSGQMSDAALAAWEPNMVLVVLMYIVEFVITLILPVMAIRFARSNRVAEAFNFRAILDHIARIGWINYVIGVILVAIIVAVPVIVLIVALIILGVVLLAMAGFSITAILGLVVVAALIFLVIVPLLLVFQARYMTRLYDGAAPVADAATPGA